MILCSATPKSLLAFVFSAASFCTAPSYAETDEDLMASGQWRDPATGLIWMRCSIGQTWTGSTCSGTPITLNWQDANDYFQIFNQNGFAGKTSWRLPKIEELVTIRRCSNGWHQETKSQLTAEGRRDVAVGTQYTTLPNGQRVPYRCAENSIRPTLDTHIFPNTLSNDYWSASPFALDIVNAWGVYFHRGSASGFKVNYSSVRAVRAGQ